MKLKVSSSGLFSGGRYHEDRPTRANKRAREVDAAPSITLDNGRPSQDPLPVLEDNDYELFEESTPSPGFMGNHLSRIHAESLLQLSVRSFRICFWIQA